ncbi:MAG TPA: PAS domain-containing sensor histidine kinase [Tepidisphaeraceae bacterium]|jgi:PAS domain S-box-containing protein
MLQLICDYRLDAAALAIFVLGAMGAVRLWLRGRGVRRVPHLAWLGLVLILIGGTWGAEFAAEAMPTRFANLPAASESKVLALALSRADILGCSGLIGFFAIAVVAIFSRPSRPVGTPSPLRTLIDLQPECVQILSTAGIILDINPAGRDLLEIENIEENQRLSFIPYVAYEDRDEIMGMLQSVANGHAASLQCEAVSHFGERRWLDVRMVPLKNPDGRVVAAFSVMRDLTELRQAQIERDRLQRELLALSQRPTSASFAADVLKDLGKALETLNTTAGTVAEKLRSGALDDVAYSMASDQNEMLEEISQLSRGVEQIKQIVATHHVMNPPTQPEVFHVTDVIEQAVRMSEASLGQKNIQVKRQYGNCPAITADRHRVLQIVVNLIINAEQAQAKEIAVDLEHVGNFARLRMTDNRPAVATDPLTQLFNPDTQSDSRAMALEAAIAAARTVGGTLSTTVNTSGPGATATLELPITSTQTTAASPATAPLQEVA